MLSFFLIFFLWFFFLLFYSVHYMIILLSLEIILLIMYYFFSLLFLGTFCLSGLFCFLTVLVCMGGFSISLLVFLSRFYGRDFWIYKFVF